MKNPTASAGFEPANLGTKGQHATSRPPKPLFYAFFTFFKMSIAGVAYFNVVPAATATKRTFPRTVTYYYTRVGILSLATLR